MRLSETVNRETQRIYQQLKRDFHAYIRATILVAYHPLNAYRLTGVHQKVAHDVSVIKKMDLLPKGSVFIFASQVTCGTKTGGANLEVINLAWLQDNDVVTLPEYEKYSAKVGVVFK